jgi:flagellar biosynthesis protein FlhA
VALQKKSIPTTATSASAASQTESGDRVNTTTARLAKNSNLFFAIGLVAILATLLIPLPTFLLDIGLACSISLSISVLIIVLATNQPVELSTFPSLLLITTLFRLALNVASTRLILLQGNAGTIIDTFGNFVAGGNLVVGLVIFIILCVIQFIVITRGASRISEVAARFVLDAMPGKQMSIDADLNAGMITDAEARSRRKDIVRESEFYGAMDGASKFIQGDAKAGLIITAVNLIGGIILGYSRGLSIQNASRQYCILSIGDGLVSQIPSIIIAISSGFLVSKVRSQNTVSTDMTEQLLRRHQPIGIAAVIIATFVLIPGFPKIPFLAIAATLAFFTVRARASAAATDKSEKPSQAKSDKTLDDSTPVEELLSVDILSILVGVRLIGMVDPRKKSGVLDRIGALRRKFVQQLGIILPLVRLRDNINLEPNIYEIRLYDHIIATGRIEPDKFLAMDSGSVTKPVRGVKTKEPVYGLPALWVAAADKEAAEVAGYTVIDPESVLITHLSETLLRHAHELLTREDVQQLVERLRSSQPSLVGDIVGELVPVGLLQRVLQNLLREGVSIRDLSLVLEALGEAAPRTKNATLLTEITRKKLMRAITEKHKTPTGSITAIAFDPVLEHQLISAVNQAGETISLNIPPEMALDLNQRLADCWKSAMDHAFENIVVLCDARIRPALSSMIERTIPRLPVLAYDEIVPGTVIEPVESVKITDAAGRLAPQPA